MSEKSAKEQARERNRRLKLLREYGVTQEEYLALYQKQQGCCAICKVAFEKWNLHIDHNHRTGKIRELLCPRCNNLVGRLEQPVVRISWTFRQAYPGLISLAEKYLQKHEGEFL